jgi:hypothetical protein
MDVKLGVSTPMEEHILQTFQERVLWRMVGRKGEGETAGCRKVRHE